MKMICNVRYNQADILALIEKDLKRQEIKTVSSARSGVDELGGIYVEYDLRMLEETQTNVQPKYVVEARLSLKAKTGQIVKTHYEKFYNDATNFLRRRGQPDWLTPAQTYFRIIESTSNDWQSCSSRMTEVEANAFINAFRPLVPFDFRKVKSGA